MTLYGLFFALRARHVLIWTTCLACAAAACGVSWLLPSKYTSTCQVLIDVLSSDSVLGQDQSLALMAPSYMATQADIVVSPRVVRNVVRILGLDQDQAALDEWRKQGGAGTPAEYFAARLKARLDVKPARESNVLTISYTDKSPKVAAAVANAYAKAYIDANIELRAAPARDVAAWFDLRVRKSRQRLDEAQQRLSDYEREHGIVANEDRGDVESARLAELNTQLTTIQSLRAESSSRERAASGVLETSPDIQQNASIVALRADVARAQSQLNELSVNFGVNHPAYQQALAELRTRQSQLRTETRRVASELSTSNSINTRREAEVRSAVEAQKQRVLSMRRDRDQLTLLQRDVDAARRDYDLVAQRRSQTSLEGQSNLTNIVVLSPAVEPATPSSPNLLVNTLAGTLLGALFGGALALAAELRRPRMRSVEDVTRALSVQILATLPPRPRRISNSPP